MHVKGVELTYTEVRCQTNLGLGFALAPNGPQGDICEHDWDFDTVVGWSHTLERTATLGIFDRVPMAQLSPEKVRNFKALNTIWSACDGINLCPFVSAPTRYFRLSQMVQLVAAVTGWDLSGYEFMRIGERRNAIMRWYNYREGLGAGDDRLPDRFYEEPIRTGRHRGARIDREQFRGMIDLYYAMSGWDVAGRPMAAKLIDLNLDWLAEGSD
jgi:aldehyde:ferredoxin oxidoreductase